VTDEKKKKFQQSQKIVSVTGPKFFPILPKMKVIDKIRKAEEEGRVYWSFEYFPPKTRQVMP
jgi:hypothetical protein